MAPEKRMLSTLVVAALLVVLAVAYYLQADALPKSRLAGHVGADGFPKMLAIALALLALGLAVQSILDIRKQKAGGTTPAAKPVEWRRHFRALGLVGIGAVYILVLPYLGYAVSVAIILAGVATYTGLKPSWQSALFAVGGALFFYVIFVKLLRIPLPSGFWPTIFG